MALTPLLSGGDSDATTPHPMDSWTEAARASLKKYTEVTGRLAPTDKRLDLARLDLASSLITTLSTTSFAATPLTEIHDARPRTITTRDSTITNPHSTETSPDYGLATEEIFTRELAARAAHFRNTALFFYQSDSVTNKTNQTSYEAIITGIFTSWQNANERARTREEYKKAIKTLYSSLDQALAQESLRIYGRHSKAINMQAMEAIYTMHLQSNARAAEAKDIVTTFSLTTTITDTGAGAGVASAAPAAPLTFEVREKEIKHFRPDQIEELLLILASEEAHHPKWFKNLPAWQKAYLQKVVGDIKTAFDLEEAHFMAGMSSARLAAGGAGTSETITTPTRPISLKRRLEKALAGSPSTLRLFGLANFYEHSATVGPITVSMMRASCPMPDPKFVKKETELARLTEANLRQYIFEAIETILAAEGGYTDSAGTKHLLITELSVLSALGVDQAFTPINENNLKMVELTREAMARVKLEFTGPILVRGQLIQVHLAHTGHPVNNSRNVPNGFAALAQSPADEAEILQYLADYLAAQPRATAGAGSAAEAAMPTTILHTIATRGTRHPLSEEDLAALETLCRNIGASKPLLANALKDYIQLLAHNDTRDIEGLNVMMFRAALEAIIISEIGGRALIHCKSGQDRAGQVCYQIDAMLEYYVRYRSLPNVLNNTPEIRHQFIEIYIAHFTKGHHARVREKRIPHSLGLKEIDNISHPAVFTRLSADESLARSTTLADISKPESGGNEWIKDRVQDLGALTCCAPGYTEESVAALAERIRSAGLSLSSASIHIEAHLPDAIASPIKKIIHSFVATIREALGEDWRRINALFPSHLFAKEPGLEAALIALAGASNEPINIATAKIWFANAEVLFNEIKKLLPTTAQYDTEISKILTTLTWMRTLVIDEITPSLWHTARKIRALKIGSPTLVATSASAARAIPESTGEDSTTTIALPENLKKILQLLKLAAPSSPHPLYAVLRYLSGNNAVYLATLLRAADKEIDNISFGAPKPPKAGKESLLKALSLREHFLKEALIKETGIASEAAHVIATAPRKPVHFLVRYGADILFVASKIGNLSLYGVVLLFLQENKDPSIHLVNALEATFYGAIVASALALLPRAREFSHLQQRLQAQASVARGKLPLAATLKECSLFALLLTLFGAWVGDSVGSATQDQELQVFPYTAVSAAAGLQIAELFIMFATQQLATGKTRKAIIAGEVLLSLAADALISWSISAMGYSNMLIVVMPIIATIQLLAIGAYATSTPKKSNQEQLVFFDPRSTRNTRIATPDV